MDEFRIENEKKEIKPKSFSKTILKAVFGISLISGLALSANCSIFHTAGITTSIPTTTMTTIPAWTDAAVANNQVLVAFDFTGTYDPDDYGVVPFIVGGVAAYIDGAADWNYGTLGPDDPGNMGLVATSTKGIWYILLTLPDELDYKIQFEAANYYYEGYVNVTNDFWGTIGTQNIGPNYENMFISNYVITKFVTPSLFTNTTFDGTKTNGITLTSDGKRVLINVADHGGWGVPIGTEPTDCDINIVMVWENVPYMIYGSNLPGTTYVWMPQLGIVTNTNAIEASIVAVPIVTGGANFLHISNITWAPGAGKSVTINGTSAYIAITVPAGSARGISYKMANKMGWSTGEQPNNCFFPLPFSSDVVLSNVAEFMN